MKRPRFSLAALMVVIAVAGAEVALLRDALYSPSAGPLEESLATVSPMFIALGYALHAICRRWASALFWCGFAMVGSVTTVVMFVSVYAESPLLDAYAELVVNPIADPIIDTTGGSNRPPLPGDPIIPFWCVNIPLMLLLYSLPSAVLAVVAGWLSTHYLITITRRRPIAPPSDGDETMPVPHAAPDRTTRGALLP